MDDTRQLARLRARHGTGIANAALSLNLNLDALRTMSASEARRIIDLCASVLRGDAWRRERLRVSDEDFAILAAVMSSSNQTNPSSDSPAGAAPPPQPVPEPAVAPVAPQEPPPPASPQAVPSTVARSRSRPA